jgi:2,3,4,5-tetrahydropyridine-2-carboxylate N-succinyltransferase
VANHDSILQQVSDFFERDELTDQDEADAREIFKTFLGLLEDGEIRSAEPTESGWRVNPRVKQGILLGFSLGKGTEVDTAEPFQFRDKDTYPTQDLPVEEKNIRLVPGGTTVRRGARIGENVTMMPPAYVNAGAYVGKNTMVDSHALVGSCAQVGKNVHISAGTQLGGVLEPIGQTPVIIEDNAFVGGNVGLFEGVQIGEEAVIGAGCNITGSLPVYDLVNETTYRGRDDQPLRIPEGAVVVPGSRPLSNDYAQEQNLQVQSPVIIKYRDAQTEASAELEDILR